MNNKNILIVTGLSGAGISSALKSLEDLGYEVFDNFPLAFIDGLIETAPEKPIAIGVDSRTRDFSTKDLIKKSNDLNAFIVFMTCDESALLKRFTETRRKHPMAKDRPVEDGITKEKNLLSPLILSADLVIDTTDLSIHDLRRFLAGHFILNNQTNFSITLTSFGFKNGIPREADIIMDVRFLRNPHWDTILKDKTGNDNDVGRYIEQDEGFAPFIQNLKNLIEPLIPRYINEGKSYLTIAIGCTGGKHRSVYCVNTLEHWFKDLKIQTYKKHRDLSV